MDVASVFLAPLALTGGVQRTRNDDRREAVAAHERPRPVTLESAIVGASFFAVAFFGDTRLVGLSVQTGSTCIRWHLGQNFMCQLIARGQRICNMID